MSSAFRPMSTPPAILKAPIVIPKILKMMLPPSANAMSVIAQVHAPRRASRRRCSGESRTVIARNVGMTAKGSTMKRIDVKIRTSSIARSLIVRLGAARRECAASSPSAPAGRAAARPAGADGEDAAHSRRAAPSRTMSERAIELVLIFTSILFIVDPFAVIPTLLAMTVRDSPDQRRVLARRGAWTCAITLIAFALGGSIIFKIFGITICAFKIAGVVLIGLNALDMEIGRA